MNISHDYIRALEKEIAILKKEIEKLKRDQLTGVYNRHYLDEVVNGKYKKHLKNSENCHYHVYLIDLVNLHRINRTEGYEMGDLYIKEVATFLQNVIREHSANGKVFRIGGDEFLIIINSGDYIPIEKFKNDKFDIVYRKWDKSKTFSEIMKLLDKEIIKIKALKKRPIRCSKCIIREYPEIIDKILDEVEKRKKELTVQKKSQNTFDKIIEGDFIKELKDTSFYIEDKDT